VCPFNQFFTEELANHKRIRLIYMVRSFCLLCVRLAQFANRDFYICQGMLLIQDRTMGEFGIEEGGVIHAVINDAREFHLCCSLYEATARH
jgi:hypothetical protein